MTRQPDPSASLATSGHGRGPLLTVDDVCEYLGISRYFVYDQVRLGRLRCIRIARQLRFRPADVDAFVDQHLVSG
jgi:excisionase family DNA binding protein